MSTHAPRFPFLHIYARTQEVKRAERAKQGLHEIPPEIEAMSAHPGVRAMTPSQAAYARHAESTARVSEGGSVRSVATGGNKRHPWNPLWQQSVIDRPILAGAQESYQSEHATMNPFRGKSDPSLMFTRHYQKMAHEGSEEMTKRSE